MLKGNPLHTLWPQLWPMLATHPLLHFSVNALRACLRLAEAGQRRATSGGIPL